MSNILAFAESWSGYSTNTGSGAINTEILLCRWTSNDNGGNFTINNDSAGNYITVGPSVNIYKTITHQSGFTCGFRTRLPTGGSHLLTFYNNNATLGNVTVNLDGTISVYAQGSGNVLIATSNAVINANRWYYFELSIALSGTTNINVAAILHVNGEELINANANSGISNANLTSLTTTLNRIGISGACDYRDIYLNNGSGQFDGDIKILAVRPNGDVVSGWNTSTGTVHYTLVNELFSDFDATYVYSTATTSQDIWDWQDLTSFGGTIKGIQISIMARKDDEGSKSFEIVTGSTGAEDSSPEFYLSDDYIAYFRCQDDDPATGVPYTVTGFNAKQFGIKVIK